jgi:CCR4-NOT transcription complex subunit 7/8
MGGNPAFGLGNANANASPFSIAGSMNSGGYERGLVDGGGAGLGSHAAQMSFARGGPVQQNTARDFDGMPLRDTKQGARIRNVWKTNLAAEMETLRQLVEDYPYIAMVGSQTKSQMVLMADMQV